MPPSLRKEHGPHQGVCSFRRCDILNLSRLPEICVPSSSEKSTLSSQLASCSRKSTDHSLGAMPERAPLILKQSIITEHHAACASPERGRSSSAPREAWTEHEHHRIELFTDPSLRERCSSMAMPRGQSHGLRASHEWYRPMSLLCVQGQRVCTA